MLSDHPLQFGIGYLRKAIVALDRRLVAMWAAISSNRGIVRFFFASLLFDVSSP